MNLYRYSTANPSSVVTASRGQLRVVTASRGQLTVVTASRGQPAVVTASRGQSAVVTASRGQSTVVTASRGEAVNQKAISTVLTSQLPRIGYSKPTASQTVTAGRLSAPLSTFSSKSAMGACHPLNLSAT